MRSAFSLLLAVLTGLMALMATVGALVDEAAHRPETLRGIAEQVASDDAVARGVTDVVDDVVPDQVPEQLTRWTEDLIRPIAAAVAQDPSVAEGWSDTVDQARRAWLVDLAQARGSQDPVPGGRFDVPFGPVVQNGVVSVLDEVETALREDRIALPGLEVAETLLGADVGDWSADTVIAPLDDLAAELRDSSELTLTVEVETLRGVDRSTVATWVAASAHWTWAAVAAFLLLAAAAVLAPVGRRGLALAAAGLTVLLGSLSLRGALPPESFAVSAAEDAPDGVAVLVREIQRAVGPAVEGTLAPWFEGLLWGGAALAGLGVMVVLAELVAGRRRGRRTHEAAEGTHRV